MWNKHHKWENMRCFLSPLITSLAHCVSVSPPPLSLVSHLSSFSPRLPLWFSHILSPFISPSIALSYPTLYHHLFSFLTDFFTSLFPTHRSVLLSQSLFPLSFSLHHLPSAKLSFSIPLSLPSYLSDRAPLCSPAALSLLIMSGTSAGPVNRDCVCVWAGKGGCLHCAIENNRLVIQGLTHWWVS